MGQLVNIAIQAAQNVAQNPHVQNLAKHAAVHFGMLVIKNTDWPWKKQ